ncbi:MAG: hypothetical protein ACOYBW_08725 [Fluviibacter phosphoraccumulans]
MTNRIGVRGFVAISGTASSITVFPAGTIAGDLVLIAISTAGAAPTTPAGWTLQASVITGTAGTAGCVAVYVYSRVLVAGDPSSLSITGIAGGYVVTNCLVLYGENATPIDVAAVTNTTTPASQTYTLAGVTTVTDDAWIVGFIGCDIDSATQVITGALTNGTVVDAVLRGGLGVTTSVGGQLFTTTARMATAGATGNLTRAEVTTASISVSATLVIRPAVSTTIQVNQSTVRVVRTQDDPTIKVNQATVRMVRTTQESAPAFQATPRITICM